jgi:hypothetical protein
MAISLLGAGRGAAVFDLIRRSAGTKITRFRKRFYYCFTNTWLKPAARSRRIG